MFGIFSGMATGALTASYGIALLNGFVNMAGSAFNSLIVGAQSIPVTPVSVGAVAGAGAGAMWTMASAGGREQRPVSASEMLGGIASSTAAGALVGGLSSFINPLTAGGVGALIQNLREINHHNPALHDQSTILGGIGRIAGVGVASGLFGGFCSLIAHSIVAAGVPALPAHLGIAAGSAVIAGVTEALSRPSPVEGEPIQGQGPFVAYAEVYEGGPGVSVNHSSREVPVAMAVPVRRN